MSHSAHNSILTLVLSLIVTSSFAQQGEWTWMKGNSNTNPLAVYGTQGVADPANKPRGLYEAGEWTDLQGNFWVYGGLSNNSPMSNLWKYDPATNEWTWMKGPGDFYNELPMYGTQGVPAPANTPGTRGWAPCSWVDTSGNLWLFGGLCASNLKSDLWMYNITTNEWTWVNGPSASNMAGTYGMLGVPAAANKPGARRETSANWTDADNNLWLFGGYGYGSTTSTQGLLNDVWRYNISTNEWTWMRGAQQIGNAGSYGTKEVEDTTNNPSSRMVYTKWKDGDGNFWIFGGGDYFSNQYYNDVWRYDPVSNKWTWMSGSNASNDNGEQDSLCNSGVDLVGPARFENRACWTDACYNFWTFGGSQDGGVSFNFNDLWHFNYLTLEWTMVNGSVTFNQLGSYGTLGVSSLTNQPPSRAGSNSFIDLDGNLWLFGGARTISDLHNDLWRYVINPLCPANELCSLSPATGFSALNPVICEKFCVDYVDQTTNDPIAWQWSFPGGSPSSSTDQNPTNICYSNPGTYDVTLITSNAGGSDTLTLSNYITVYPTPPFPIITQSGYTLTSTPATTYQWQLNSVDIPGATNQLYTVIQTGFYTVIVSDSNGCVNSTTLYVEITGVEELFSGMNISIYPNPSTGNFVVEWSYVLTHSIAMISVTNALGQEIFSSEENIHPSSWKKEIDLSLPASGIYFIEIITENDFVRKKIVIAD